jgi:hypothetical protein
VSQATSGFFDLVLAMGSPEEIEPRGSETLPVADKELTDYSHDGDESGREYPTELEMKTLRRVSDHIPWITLSVAFVELCERFSYYGTTVVCMYFIHLYVSPHLLRGALLSNESGISNPVLQLSISSNEIFQRDQQPALIKVFLALWAWASAPLSALHCVSPPMGNYISSLSSHC